MDFLRYQFLAKQYAIYPNIGTNYEYPLKGLFSEVGEVADKFKKIERDKNNIRTTEDDLAIGKELGDCLWYISQLASELDLNLDVIAQDNLAKLQKRMDENKLKGSGDNR
jgi:NTP pyrophosphatase (non-canonical NTP hydrolase)